MGRATLRVGSRESCLGAKWDAQTYTMRPSNQARMRGCIGLLDNSPDKRAVHWMILITCPGFGSLSGYKSFSKRSVSSGYF